MKRSEVIPAVIAAITPVTSPAVVVIRNDYSQAAADSMESELRTADHGIVAAVEPIQGASTGAGQVVKRGAFASDSRITIALRMNPKTKPASMDADKLLDIADLMICALLAYPSLDCELSGAFLDLIPEDSGLVTYAITFTVKTDTSAT